MSCAELGKFEPGMQAKPDDCWVVPLCSGHHRTLPCSQHNIGEEHFWKSWNIDPFALALSLWRARNDAELMDKIVRDLKNVSAI